MTKRTLPMKALAFLAAVFVLASEVQADPMPDPIAPAAAGKLQCYSPDTVHKTCSSLASYRTNTNGTIDNTATVLVSRNPVLTMETISPIEIRAGKVCGRMREHDIDAAKFAIGGQELDAKRADTLRKQLKIAYKDVFDHEICTAYVPDGGTLVAKATMEAARMPEQRVKWVSPNDGYKVSP